MSEFEVQAAGDRYPDEVLGEDEDDGTMPESLASLREAVVGRRIRSVEEREIPGEYYGTENALVMILDNAKEVRLVGSDDCCAFTELTSFFRDPSLVDHVITGVGTTDGFTVWHIYADLGDVMRLNVDWSCGNPFYYGYGFDVRVEPVTIVTDAPEMQRLPRELEGGAA